MNGCGRIPWRAAWLGSLLASALGLGSAALSAPPASAAGPGFVAGGALATSQTLKIGPRTAGLDYSVTLGVATATYVNQQGRSQAQSIKLGLVGLLLTTGVCGRPPALAELPPTVSPVIADSRSGSEQHSQDVAALPGPLAGLAFAGNERAQAGPGPTSSAVTSDSGFNLAGLATLTGIDSDATARLEGHARDANASSSVKRVVLAGGAVSMSNLHWWAHLRTGAGPAAEAGFTMGALAVGGLPLDVSTPQALSASMATANTALQATGVQVVLPHSDPGRDGSLTMTPLDIVVTGGTVTGPVTASAIGQLQTTREQATGLLPQSCEEHLLTGGLLTPVDLVADSLAGVGSSKLSLGGAYASTDAASYANPFGNVPGAYPEVIRAPGAPPVTTFKQGLGAITPPAARAVPRTSSPAAALTSWCRTVHPIGTPACWGGDGLAAGSVALVLSLLLLVADLVSGAVRRRRPS
ncbi:MAG: hypothetical protein ABR598_03820 [Candidatus Dormibacteria bacterium]